MAIGTSKAARDKEIIRRLVAGERLANIAKSVDLSYGYLVILVNQDKFKQQVEEQQHNLDLEFTQAYIGDHLGLARRIVENHAVDAAERIVDGLGSADEKIALTAARDLLDRNMIKGVDQVHSEHLLVFSGKQERDFFSALKDLSAHEKQSGESNSGSGEPGENPGTQP